MLDFYTVNHNRGRKALRPVPDINNNTFLSAWEWAGYNGRIDILEKLLCGRRIIHKNIMHPWSEYGRDRVLYWAAAGDHVETMDWAVKRLKSQNTTDVYDVIMEQGSFRALIWMGKYDGMVCDGDELLLKAARGGHLSHVAYVTRRYRCRLEDGLCIAAEYGRLGVVKFIMYQSKISTEHICHALNRAAKGLHYDTCKYLMNHCQEVYYLKQSVVDAIEKSGRCDLIQLFKLR